MEANELVRYMLAETGISIKAFSDGIDMNYQTLRNKSNTIFSRSPKSRESQSIRGVIFVQSNESK